MGGLVKRAKEKNSITVMMTMSIRAVGIKLTFTRLHSLRPHVINVSVAETPAGFIPGSPRSAATDSAGSLKLAALWARHRIG